ncbi:MAG: hypothetical protein WBE72_22605, partial [Terracidiphilus sp.]
MPSAAPTRDEEDLLALLGKPAAEPPAAAPAPAPAPPPAPAPTSYPPPAPASYPPPASFVAEPAPPAVPPPAPSQGEFTRMLQALKTPEPSGGLPAARPSEELAKVFSPVPMERIPSADKTPPAFPAVQAEKPWEPVPSAPPAPSPPAGSGAAQ